MTDFVVRRNEENAELQRSLVRRSQELQRSELRLSGFLAAVPDAIVIVDRRASILFARDRVRQMFGHGPGALVGQPITALLPERFRTGHQAFVRAYMAAPTTRNMRADGDLYALRVDGRSSPSRSGAIPTRSTASSSSSPPSATSPTAAASSCSFAKPRRWRPSET